MDLLSWWCLVYSGDHHDNISAPRGSSITRVASVGMTSRRDASLATGLHILFPNGRIGNGNGNG